MSIELDLIKLFNNLNYDKPNIKFLKQNIPNQPKEKYYGNREYKLHMIFDNKKNIRKKMAKRSTQLCFRLNEGNGKALYLIGINDNGDIIGLSNNQLIESIKNICEISNFINCSIKSICIYNINDPKHITTNKIDIENISTLKQFSTININIDNDKHFQKKSKYLASIRFYKELKLIENELDFDL